MNPSSVPAAIRVACAVAVALLLAAAPLAAAPAAATYKTTPKPVVQIYADITGMFGTLLKNIAAATKPAAVAKAFDQATAYAKEKRLVERYRELMAAYPEFFRVTDEEDPSWTPPSDWDAIYARFERQLNDYGATAGEKLASMGTPEVMEAMDRFGAVMEGLAPGE